MTTLQDKIYEIQPLLQMIENEGLDNTIKF